MKEMQEVVVYHDDGEKVRLKQVRYMGENKQGTLMFFEGLTNGKTLIIPVNRIIRIEA